jgi:hypothetical protein
MIPTTSKVGGRDARQETGITTRCGGHTDEVPAPPPEVSISCTIGVLEK